MKNRAAYGALSIILILLTVLSLLLGVFWFATGIASGNSDSILKGCIALILGAAFGAVTNFLK